MGKDNIIQISKPVQKSLETNDTHIKLELTKQGTPWRRESDNPPIEDLPDGGWGWLIVISSMIIHLIVAGFDRASGILYLQFRERFDGTSSTNAWVASLSISLKLGVGPIALALCNRISYRIVVVVGGFILGCSMIISGLSPNIYVLFASFGVLGGIGKAFAFGPGVVIVGLYFNKRRSLAVGLATSGVALGAFTVPLIVEISFSHYGYFGAFLIMTGIAFQIIVCGFLLRPFSFQRRVLEYERSKKKTDHQDGEKETGKGEINENIQQNVHVMSIELHDYFRKQDVFQITSTKGNEEMERNNFGKMFDINLLKNIRFLGLCIAILFLNFTFQSAMIFLPALAEPVGIGYCEVFPIIIVGIFDGLGRMISGFLFDSKYIAPIRLYVYNFALVAFGFVTFLFPFVRNPLQLGLVCVIFGLLLGNCISQQSVVIIDTLGEQNLSCGFGILLFFQGIGAFVGPPISGLMKDINGSYDYAFYLGSVCAITGASVLVGASVVHRKLHNGDFIVSPPNSPNIIKQRASTK